MGWGVWILLMSAGGGLAEGPLPPNRPADPPSGTLHESRPRSPEIPQYHRQWAVMGTLLTLHLPRAGGTEVAVAESVIRKVEEVEERLSTWNPASELSRLNRSPLSTPVSVSPDLLRVLREVLPWREKTLGAFAPEAGALGDAWGIRRGGRHPTLRALERALQASAPGTIALDSSGHWSRGHPGAWVDAGGFGKGAALREAREVLRGAGVHRALLDLGGQLLAMGGGSGGWPIAVAHPSIRSRALALEDLTLPTCETHVSGPASDVSLPSSERSRLFILHVSDASVATSGASERSVQVEGDRIGHILDPRTGRPVPPWGSVTVIASDPLVADILATGLFVLGPEQGVPLAESLPGIEALFFSTEAEGIRARWTSGTTPMISGGGEMRGKVSAILCRGHSNAARERDQNRPLAGWLLDPANHQQPSPGVDFLWHP